MRDQASYRSEEWAGGFQARLLPRTMRLIPWAAPLRPKRARREMVRRTSQVPPRVHSRVCIRAEELISTTNPPRICCGCAAKEHVAILHKLSCRRRKRVEHSAQNDFEPKSYGLAVAIGKGDLDRRTDCYFGDICQTFLPWRAGSS